jgi:phosphate transport system substrate-binding protein
MRLRAFWVGLAVLASPANADNMLGGGVGAATALLPILYSQVAEGRTKLEVIPSLGSSGGLKALSEGAIDMAVSGRPLTQAEINQGLFVAASIDTPFVVVTSQSGPIGLAKSKVSEAFSDAKSTWADGSPIRVIVRPKTDSDTAVWIANFPGMEAALENARLRHDVPTAATDQDNADMAERIKSSLTAITLTQMLTERRTLSLVSIDGVRPSVEAMEIGTYPYRKTLHFVFSSKKPSSENALVAFLTSSAGDALLRKYGCRLISSMDSK